jgi:hypothetical protein
MIDSVRSERDDSGELPAANLTVMFVAAKVDYYCDCMYLELCSSYPASPSFLIVTVLYHTAERCLLVNQVGV